mmetsp:Transcript_11388/g.36044  ORF Transcript_11388/g.36044 Transcript_11388/m.36044 type:complete len:226 (+) Transcript_11388:42-719(+)
MGTHNGTGQILRRTHCPGAHIWRGWRAGVGCGRGGGVAAKPPSLSAQNTLGRLRNARTARSPPAAGGGGGRRHRAPSRASAARDTAAAGRRWGSISGGRASVSRRRTHPGPKSQRCRSRRQRRPSCCSARACRCRRRPRSPRAPRRAHARCAPFRAPPFAAAWPPPRAQRPAAAAPTPAARGRSAPWTAQTAHSTLRRRPASRRRRTRRCRRGQSPACLARPRRP